MSNSWYVSLACLVSMVCSPCSAQTIKNGSFDDPTGIFISNPNQSAQMAPDWMSGDNLRGTPDWDRPPGLFGGVPASPDGDLFMRMLGFDSVGGDVLITGESIEQKGITGFQVGETYRVDYQQINTPEKTNGTNEDGYLGITLFGTTVRSPTLAANSNVWSPASAQFIATSVTTDIRIQAFDANPGNANIDGRTYMGVDGVAVSLVPVLGPLRNFDVVNRTGQLANDFHMTLMGVTPDQVASPSLVQVENYPDVEKTAVPGGTRISWRSSTGTPAGDREHFGYRLIGNQARTSGVEMEWTRDGQSIGKVAAAEHIWTRLPTGSVRGGIRLDENFRDEEVYLTRSTTRRPGRAILSDLVVGSPIWETAEAIDSTPIRIAPGELHSFELEASLDIEESAVMVFDFWSAPVDTSLPREQLQPFLLATYFEAIPLVPSSEMVSGHVDAGNVISIVGQDVDLLGLDFISATGELVSADDPSPFAFVLSNTNQQVTIGNLGDSVRLDGSLTTSVRYTGSDPLNDLQAFYGDSNGRVVPFDVYRSPVMGDVNSDGAVDFTDFLILSDNFGGVGALSQGDLDRDGNVGFTDFLILADHFGNVSTVSNVPEPGWEKLVAAWVLGLLFLHGRQRPVAMNCRTTSNSRRDVEPTLVASR